MTTAAAARASHPRTVTLSVTIPVDQLPAEGESTEVRLDSGLYVRIENRGNLRLPELLKKRERPAPETLTYVPVMTTAHASEVVHAAITRRVNGRNRTERFTICDRNGKRIVGRRLSEPLDVVTCKQCRNQLAEDGVLDEA